MVSYVNVSVVGIDIMGSAIAGPSLEVGVDDTAAMMKQFEGFYDVHA
jgi:hypothetical protein